MVSESFLQEHIVVNYPSDEYLQLMSESWVSRQEEKNEQKEEMLWLPRS